MKAKIKNNYSFILGLFILLSPFIDLITGVTNHSFNTSISIAIIFRGLFLLFIIFSSLIVFKKKKLLIPYSIIFIYFILYILGIILFKNNYLLIKEIQSFVKVFYFPILLISLYHTKEYINISKLTLIVTLFIYLFMIFIPIVLNLGFNSYEIAKKGTVGFFIAANEISGIISILTPIAFIVILSSKNIFSKLSLLIIYLIVILTLGTKTPLLSLILTIFVILTYYFLLQVKNKEYKKLLLPAIITVILGMLLFTLLPKTNFYRNIEIHLNFLKVEKITDIAKDKDLIDHFIFSQRLTFLTQRNKVYQKANIYQKLVGIGYLNSDQKSMKLIEMDYFDIFYSHGLIGFIIYFIILTLVLIPAFKNKTTKDVSKYLNNLSLFLIIVLSLITGHIITAPAVSYIATIIIISSIIKEKKELLFASYNFDIGGIEKALVNLVNAIDKEKYNVTIVLEEKKGLFLDLIDKNIVIKELKVSNNQNVVIRKAINVTRKLLFKIFNYHKYDFSCCYTTYSYSANAITKISSTNTNFYVHNNYKSVYKKEKDFREFFDSRKVTEYKRIIFVSNECKEGFIDYYPNLKDKCIVINNLINIAEIKKLSKEKIDIKKNNDNRVFVFVGRLDDDAKKVKRAIDIVKNIDKTELWLVGDGPDRQMYEEYADGDINIRFLGKKSNPYPYIVNSDFLILTSDYEGFPVTYLEALLLNKQIITTIRTSEDLIDIKDYAFIISKEKDTMLKEVKDILKDNRKKKTIDMKKIQDKRMKMFENIFDN